MAHMEPYVKEWYDYLHDGKLMGLRCKDCGAYIFPPIPFCDECGSHNVEWAEMSGEATIETIAWNPGGDTFMGSLPPSMGAYARLKEGPVFSAPVPAVDPEKVTDLIMSTPLKAHLEISKVDEELDLYYPYFVIDE